MLASNAFTTQYLRLMEQ